MPRESKLIFVPQKLCTVCPRSLDRFCIVSYYMNWVKNSWTYSIRIKLIRIRANYSETVCPRGLNPYCMVGYYIKWVKTSWTNSIRVICPYPDPFYCAKDWIMIQIMSKICSHRTVVQETSFWAKIISP